MLVEVVKTIYLHADAQLDHTEGMANYNIHVWVTMCSIYTTLFATTAIYVAIREWRRRTRVLIKQHPIRLPLPDNRCKAKAQTSQVLNASASNIDKSAPSWEIVHATPYFEDQAQKVEIITHCLDSSIGCVETSIKLDYTSSGSIGEIEGCGDHVGESDEDKDYLFVENSLNGVLVNLKLHQYRSLSEQINYQFSDDIKTNSSITNLNVDEKSSKYDNSELMVDQTPNSFTVVPFNTIQNHDIINFQYMNDPGSTYDVAFVPSENINKTQEEVNDFYKNFVIDAADILEIPTKIHDSVAKINYEKPLQNKSKITEFVDRNSNIFTSLFPKELLVDYSPRYAKQMKHVYESVRSVIKNKTKESKRKKCHLRSKIPQICDYNVVHKNTNLKESNPILLPLGMLRRKISIAYDLDMSTEKSNVTKAISSNVPEKDMKICIDEHKDILPSAKMPDNLLLHKSEVEFVNAIYNNTATPTALEQSANFTELKRDHKLNIELDLKTHSAPVLDSTRLLSFEKMEITAEKEDSKKPVKTKTVNTTAKTRCIKNESAIKIQQHKNKVSDKITLRVDIPSQNSHSTHEKHKFAKNILKENKSVNDNYRRDMFVYRTTDTSSVSPKIPQKDNTTSSMSFVGINKKNWTKNHNNFAINKDNSAQVRKKLKNQCKTTANQNESNIYKKKHTKHKQTVETIQCKGDTCTEVYKKSTMTSFKEAYSGDNSHKTYNKEKLIITNPPILDSIDDLMTELVKSVKQKVGCSNTPSNASQIDLLELLISAHNLMEPSSISNDKPPFICLDAAPKSYMSKEIHAATSGEVPFGMITATGFCVDYIGISSSLKKASLSDKSYMINDIETANNEGVKFLNRNLTLYRGETFFNTEVDNIGKRISTSQIHLKSTSAHSQKSSNKKLNKSQKLRKMSFGAQADKILKNCLTSSQNNLELASSDQENIMSNSESQKGYKKYFSNIALQTVIISSSQIDLELANADKQKSSNIKSNSTNHDKFTSYLKPFDPSKMNKSAHPMSLRVIQFDPINPLNNVVIPPLKLAEYPEKELFPKFSESRRYNSDFRKVRTCVEMYK